MSERFYINQPITGDTACLDGPEAHHLMHVMRLKEGARAVLFDGSGAEFDAQVASTTRREVQLAVLGRREVTRERHAPLVVGAALPKGDRQRTLVEKLTELGATRLVPLATSRSVVKLSAGGREKLRRAVVEACKQCQRNRLMQIEPPRPWEEFIAQAPAAASRLVAHPGGVTPPAVASDAELWVAVGPEGGLDDEEVASAQHAGWQAVSLGPRILRIETAAIALAARYG